MLWYFLRNTLYHCFWFYFKRTRFSNASRVREKGPMFIAMNHPNAFMDPISFAALLFYPRTYYMARGDAFKRGLATMALQSMGIVPIYRLRDGGYENVKKNLESFKTAYRLLDRGSRIMVFAEGLSIKERRLRSIQKGTAKMSFGYLEQGGNKDLKIVPVGVNYAEPEKFRTYAYFQVGEPIRVKDLYEEYKAQPAQAILKLTNLIEERMKPLVPSLLHKENDVLIEQLQPILKRQYIDQNKLEYHDPADQQKYWEFIIARLNTLTQQKPGEMAEFRSKVDAYTRQLQELDLRDHLLYRDARGGSLLNFVNVFLLLIGFPIYLVGKILNALAYYAGPAMARKKVKHIEFKASITFGVSSLALNFLFLIELVIVWLIFRNWYVLPAYAVLKFVTGVIGLNYSPFKKKMLGAFRFRSLRKNRPETVTSLHLLRKQVIEFIGDFT